MHEGMLQPVLIIRSCPRSECVLRDAHTFADEQIEVEAEYDIAEFGGTALWVTDRGANLTLGGSGAR